MKRIAFLGPEGTVSEEAARYFIQEESYDLVPYKLISDVFAATDTGQTDLSVIPIENTIKQVSEFTHGLTCPQGEFTHSGGMNYPSRQNLIGHLKDGDEPDFSQIKKVMSYHVAIAQCGGFLQEYLPQAELENVSSTAEGVRLVKETPTKG